jgi:soluble cytochrome b562
MNRVFVFLLLSALFGLTLFAAQKTAQPEEQPTADEQREARAVANAFSQRLQETKDFAVVMKEFYRKDFIDRYINEETKLANEEQTAKKYRLFLPGLEYDTKLLTQASHEDWQRFYVAGQNFLYLGLVNAITKLSPEQFSKAEFEATDLYSQDVIDLLEKNPNFAGFIEKKNKSSKPISTVDEMRNAIVTLEKAGSMIREQQAKFSAEQSKHYKEMINLIAFVMARKMSTSLEIADKSNSYGLPEGTRLISTFASPIFYLILAKEDGHLKILSAQYVAE